MCYQFISFSFLFDEEEVLLLLEVSCTGGNDRPLHVTIKKKRHIDVPFSFHFSSFLVGSVVQLDERLLALIDVSFSMIKNQTKVFCPFIYLSRMHYTKHCTKCHMVLYVIVVSFFNENSYE